MANEPLSMKDFDSSAFAVPAQSEPDGWGNHLSNAGKTGVTGLDGSDVKIPGCAGATVLHGATMPPAADMGLSTKDGPASVGFGSFETKEPMKALNEPQPMADADLKQSPLMKASGPGGMGL